MPATEPMSKPVYERLPEQLSGTLPLYEAKPEVVQLAVRDLRIAYAHSRGAAPVVNGIGFDVYRGETVALLGESGSGKSTVAKALLGLLPPSARIDGGSLTIGDFRAPDLSAGRIPWERVRGREIAMLFQDAQQALNPLMKIKDQLREGLARHRPEAASRSEAIGEELLEQLNFRDGRAVLESYPFELSGGMCQRVCLALSLSLEPSVLIADEPTSALDTVSQREVLGMLREVRGRLGLTVLLITHDMAVARAAADRVLVMDKGSLVESGDVRTVFAAPQATATIQLLAARAQTLRLAGSRAADAEAVIQAAVQAGHGMLPRANSEAASEAVLGVTSKVEVTSEVESEAKAGVASAAALVVSPEASSKTLLRTSSGAASGESSAPLLSIRQLVKSFGPDRPVLRELELAINRGERLGILGQSGSGKSTLARCIAGLEQPDGGCIWMNGADLTRLSGRARRAACRQIQLVFQDARGSLNPRRTALALVQEPLRYMQIGNRKQRAELALSCLREVGLTGDVVNRRPPQLSTGQCQRVAIARALVVQPELLVCDEAVSALDMSVQAQILALLDRLQREHRFAVVMISHDSRVLRAFCDTVAVLHNGVFKEGKRKGEQLHESEDPYTRMLLQSAAELERGLPDGIALAEEDDDAKRQWQEQEQAEAVAAGR